MGENVIGIYSSRKLLFESNRTMNNDSAKLRCFVDDQLTGNLLCIASNTGGHTDSRALDISSFEPYYPTL